MTTIHIDRFNELIDALESIARSLDTIANPPTPTPDQLRQDWLFAHDVHLQKGAVREPLDPSILAAGGVIVTAPDEETGPEDVDWGGGKDDLTPDDLDDVN